MEKFLKNGKIRVVLAMAIVAVMFGTLMIVNLLTPPIGDDDYYYRQGLIDGTTIPVQNISDAFRSAVNAYKMHTGRILTDCFAHLIFSKLDKTVVAFIYSALYMLTVWLMYLLIRGKRENSICLFVGINLSLWMFVPELGQDIFWWTGVANYLLPMPLILGILLIYRCGCDSNNDGVVKCLLIGLLGVISGWQLENSSIAVPFVTLAYICLWKYKGLKIPKWAWSGFAGSMLGYILLVAAPGNYQRYEYEIEYAEHSLPLKFAVITYDWIMFVGILTTLFVVGVIKCRRNNPGAVCEGIIFAGAALVTAYCMIVAPSSPERTWFITVSLMTVAAGIVLKEVFPLKQISYGTKIVLCTAALMLLGTMGADTILNSYDIHEQFTQREEIIMTAKQNGETAVSVPAYELKHSLKANRYVLHGSIYDYDIEKSRNAAMALIYDDIEKGQKTAMTLYYGVDVIIETDGE